MTGQDDTHIISQRSTHKFLVSDTSGSWTEVLTLVDTVKGGLSAGEFMIDAVEADGTPSRVMRFYNRTVRLTGPVKRKWSLASAVEFVITGMTTPSAAVCVVTVANTSTLTTGDSVLITDMAVGGSVEANGETYVIIVVNSTTFSLNGTDGDNFAAYTSGGQANLLNSAAGLASVDVQAS